MLINASINRSSFKAVAVCKGRLKINENDLCEKIFKRYTRSKVSYGG